MGMIIHKKTEFLGEAVVCTNVYMSVSKEEVSITQDIYYNDRIAHKNNVMMDVDDLIHILQRAKGCIMDDQQGEIDKTIEELEQDGVSTENYSEIEGLGDLIESALGKIGITEERFKSWFNLEECDCAKRKEWLNSVFSFKR